MPYFVYMLRSEASGRHYYGYTSDLKQRVQSHQSTQNKYTRGKGPWVLLGYARYDTKAECQLPVFLDRSKVQVLSTLDWSKFR